MFRKVRINIFFLPNMITGCYHINAEVLKEFHNFRRDAAAVGAVFAIYDNSIDGVFFS